MHTPAPQHPGEISRALKATFPDLPARPPLFTIKQFAERNPAFSESALWNIRFKSKARQSSKGPVETNGAEFVFVNVGRKVLIDEAKFFEWIRCQQLAA